MEYPVFIEGRPCGALTERAEGLYTVFTADCPRRGGLIRLWLHGGGASACLGLLAPCGERMTLTRRLSRLAREALPQPIERVTDRAFRDPAPAAPPEPPEGGWRPLPDGSLLHADGRRAIPAALPPESALAAHLLRIGGRDYLVFRL